MFLLNNYIILGTSLMPDVLISNGDNFIKPFPTYTNSAGDDIEKHLQKIGEYVYKHVEKFINLSKCFQNTSASCALKYVCRYADGKRINKWSIRYKV